MAKTSTIFVKGVTKRFPGVVANDHVSLEVRAGEVLALLGENGAGKTTLMKIVAGYLDPDEGEVLVDGEPLRLGDPRDAVRRGIVLVPQHPKLIESMSVAENVGLALHLSGIKISRDGVRRLVSEVSKSYGLEVPPDSSVSLLSMGERQRVEIVKALALKARFLLLDEPTTHLTPREVDRLTTLMKRLSRDGRGVVFITHKIGEALSVADRVAVMRGGRLVGVMDAPVTGDKLLGMMFDRSVPPPSRRRGSVRGGGTVLEVRDLWVRRQGRWVVRGVSLRVSIGEIVGIAGVAGNGQRELFEAIVGLREADRGVIRIYKSGRNGVAELGIIPEERLGWGLVPGKSIVFNVALGVAQHNSLAHRGFFFDWRRVRDMAGKVVSEVGVAAPSLDAPVETLSGGNMQKLIVGRELIKRPGIVVSMNPTSGLDYVSSISVRRSLIEAAERAGVLVISEDLDELLDISDRIYVMSRGAIHGPYTRPFNVDEIARVMTL